MCDSSKVTAARAQKLKKEAEARAAQVCTLAPPLLGSHCFLHIVSALALARARVAAIAEVRGLYQHESEHTYAWRLR